MTPLISTGGNWCSRQRERHGLRWTWSRRSRIFEEFPRGAAPNADGLGEAEELDSSALDVFSEGGIIATGDSIKDVKDALAKAALTGDDDLDTCPSGVDLAPDLGLNVIPFEPLDIPISGKGYVLTPNINCTDRSSKTRSFLGDWIDENPIIKVNSS